MARKKKNPEIRKNEFIGVATKLFIKQGYEQTSLRNILKAFGGQSEVSPSVFYYYFESKDELLNVCLDAYVVGYANDMITVINDGALDYAAKMQKIVDRVDRAILDFHQIFPKEEGNYVVSFHHLIEDRFFHKILPHLAQLIRDGLESGLLPMTPLAQQTDPQTIAWLLCNGVMTIFHHDSTDDTNTSTTASTTEEIAITRLPAFVAQLLGIPLSDFEQPR